MVSAQRRQNERANSKAPQTPRAKTDNSHEVPGCRKQNTLENTLSSLETGWHDKTQIQENPVRDRASKNEAKETRTPDPLHAMQSFQSLRLTAISRKCPVTLGILKEHRTTCDSMLGRIRAENTLAKHTHDRQALTTCINRLVHGEGSSMAEGPAFCRATQ